VRPPAIQLAKHAGATVLATAGSDDKCEKALASVPTMWPTTAPADVTGWARGATAGAGVDMVFDHVGPALWAQSMFSLKPRGRIVNCGNTTGDQATIPSLGFMFHMGIQILGSDPYRYEEFAEAGVEDLLRRRRSRRRSTPCSPWPQRAEAQEKMLAGLLRQDPPASRRPRSSWEPTRRTPS
jgi:NADPH:quinone reductase-like Zn-dependent oxidoreductase